MSRTASVTNRTVPILGGCVLLFAALCMGCWGASSAGPTAEGAKVLLEAEPADPMGVVELKSSMITGIAPMDGSTAIVGKVVSGQDWEPDQAMFLIRDLQAASAHSHDHGDGDDDHSDCAFCQAKDKETGLMALIRVVNAEGNTITVDARKLLGLEENLVVVALGGGTIDEDGTLVFAASRIFIRPAR